MSSVVSARGLVKRYKDVVALDGLDLDVPQGTVLGLLGPNGAGKTTAVSVLTTLLIPDSGTATVAGIDVLTDPGEVRKRIGLSGQYAAVDEVLTGRENLVMIGRLYHLGRAVAKRRAAELLERFDLVEAGDRQVKTYSGGMRRRLDLACALVAKPPVLFLDEPTTGLDPRSRLDLWSVIRELVADGATLLLTTQYLEEADQLADDILVIDRGQAIAHGTSDALKRQVGGERIEIVATDSDRLDDAASVLERVGVGTVEVHRAQRHLEVPVNDGADSLATALTGLREANIDLQEVGLRRPTLDDVFLALTGHRTQPEDADDASDGSNEGAA